MACRSLYCAPAAAAAVDDAAVSCISVRGLTKKFGSITSSSGGERTSAPIPASTSSDGGDTSKLSDTTLCLPTETGAAEEVPSGRKLSPRFSFSVVPLPLPLTLLGERERSSPVGAEDTSDDEDDAWEEEEEDAVGDVTPPPTPCGCNKAFPRVAPREKLPPPPERGPPPLPGAPSSIMDRSNDMLRCE